MKKTSSLRSRNFKLNVEYAALTINTDNIEERSGANIDDGEFIRSHWQKYIIKHQPPIIRTMEDLKLLDKGKNS